MAKTRQQKEDSVTKLSKQLDKAKSVVFADYKGLTMKQLSDLRDKLHDTNAKLTITKNSLLKRAMPETYDPQPTTYQGPTATLFTYDDEISSLKILVKALKNAAVGRIKSGFFGNVSLDEEKVLQLAALPTKLELRGKTIGILAAPLQGMISVLNGNLRNLVYALNQIKLSKGGEE